MIRPADAEMIVRKEEVYTHKCLETDTTCYVGPCGEAAGAGRCQRGEGRAFTGVPVEGKGEAG